jgi:hypothetical protein
MFILIDIKQYNRLFIAIATLLILEIGLVFALTGFVLIAMIAR